MEYLDLYDNLFIISIISSASPVFLSLLFPKKQNTEHIAGHPYIVLHLSNRKEEQP